MIKSVLHLSQEKKGAVVDFTGINIHSSWQRSLRDEWGESKSILILFPRGHTQQV
jgi:hypothetical protein